MPNVLERVQIKQQNGGSRYINQISPQQILVFLKLIRHFFNTIRIIFFLLKTTYLPLVVNEQTPSPPAARLVGILRRCSPGPGTPLHPKSLAKVDRWNSTLCTWEFHCEVTGRWLRPKWRSCCCIGTQKEPCLTSLEKAIFFARHKKKLYKKQQHLFLRPSHSQPKDPIKTFRVHLNLGTKTFNKKHIHLLNSCHTCTTPHECTFFWGYQISTALRI